MSVAIAAEQLARVIGASPLVQPPLPFADIALEPVISARTLAFHHGKHHKGYFDALARLVADTPMAGWTLEAIILASHDQPEQRGIFNNAAQCWNHNFYWQSLSPAAQTPGGDLAAAIERDFGSLAALRAELAAASIAQFGTGWGWLVSDASRLRVLSTGDADVPFTQGLVPLLTIDVWEHAYYLDWQNRRADHVEALVASHLDWAFAAGRFAAARGVPAG
jgi:Fe-Mn family superoxide dismutase